MTRTDIINHLADKLGCRTYLEVGVRNPADNFLRIRCADRTGVDPALNESVGIDCRVHQRTSEEHYRKCSTRYDLIFIDGDHSYAGARLDLALWPGRANKAVVVHDCIPVGPESIGDVKPNTGFPWNGNVWRAWAEYRSETPFATFVMPWDHGCGIILPGRKAWSAPWIPDDLTIGAYLGNLATYAGKVEDWPCLS